MIGDGIGIGQHSDEMIATSYFVVVVAHSRDVWQMHRVHDLELCSGSPHDALNLAIEDVGRNQPSAGRRKRHFLDLTGKQFVVIDVVTEFRLMELFSEL